MMSIDGSGDRRRLLWLGAVAAVLVAAAMVVGLSSSRGRITGQTAEERIRCISRLADDQALGAGEVIASAAREDPDASVRAAALRCLMRFPGAGHRQTIEAGTGDSSPAARAAAASAMAQYADESAVDRLGGLLTGDADEQVRLAAADALGANTHPKSVVVLMEAADGEQNTVRFWALRALLGKFAMTLENWRQRTDSEWRKAIELAKTVPGVQQAFKDCGRPLVRRPAG